MDLFGGAKRPQSQKRLRRPQRLLMRRSPKNLKRKAAISWVLLEI